MKVTTTLLLRCNAPVQIVVEVIDMKIMSLLRHRLRGTPGYERMNKHKPTTPMRIRASRFLTDRYADRERPEYLIELVAFGVIAITVILWLANAMATLR